MIYLDSAATTPVRREVLEAMWPYFSAEFGNPSSHHEMGARAAAALKDARERVARCLNCRASEIIFTSGGTEADNLAVKGIALAADPARRVILTTAIEHEAVLAACDYLRRFHRFRVEFLPLEPGTGLVDVEAAAALMQSSAGEIAMISVMLANNEVGTIQPIDEMTALAHVYGLPLHTDAVQAAGALPLDIKALGRASDDFLARHGIVPRGAAWDGVDALSLSGHKIGAPKGVGCLYLRGRIAAEPVLHGGGQERGRRSGTENVAFAVGFAVALELATKERADRAKVLAERRDQLIRGVLGEAPTAILTGPDPLPQGQKPGSVAEFNDGAEAPPLQSALNPSDGAQSGASFLQRAENLRLPGNISFCFPETSGESVLLELERRGILCSSGSACAAGSSEPSHVLLALGFAPQVAQTAVRFTLATPVTEAEIAETVRAVGEILRALR